MAQVPDVAAALNKELLTPAGHQRTSKQRRKGETTSHIEPYAHGGFEFVY